MRDVLRFLIDDFHERALPTLTQREARMPEIPGKANVVVGMRRSGKTWFCFQRMSDLLARGVEKERLLYLNFEDERLLPFRASDFQLILETYYSMSPSLKDSECHLFLDEVQRIDGWDMFVRRVLDTERMAVYITGSSAKLLSKEIASRLRGRSITTEMFPFSYRESLRYHGIDANPAQRIGSKRRATLQHFARQYLEIGGFPEVQRLDTELRRRVLREYLDVVVLRDVIERHGIVNTSVVRALIRHAMHAPAARISLNKFYNSLRSQGLACTKNSLYDYLDYLTDTYLLYTVPIFSRSEQVRRVNPSKMYVVDTGLASAMSFQMTEDRGAMLENMVFVHIRRQGLEPCYYITRSGAEVDFATNTESSRQPILLQVCWDMRDSRTADRERAALMEAMDELGVRKGTIVTWLDEDTSDDRIEVVPAWRWMLSPTAEAGP